VIDGANGEKASSANSRKIQDEKVIGELLQEDGKRPQLVEIRIWKKGNSNGNKLEAFFEKRDHHMNPGAGCIGAILGGSLYLVKRAL